MARLRGRWIVVSAAAVFVLGWRGGPSPSAAPREPGGDSPSQADFGLTWLGQSFGSGLVENVVGSGHHALVGIGRRLVAIDVSTPSAPRQAGEPAVLSGSVRGVAVDRGIAVVAAGSAGGLHVVDIADPGHLSPRGRVDTPGEALGVAVDGPWAFVADGAAGLRAIDVADPARPRDAGGLALRAAARRVAVRAGTAFVATAEGVAVVDVRVPAIPRTEGWIDAGGAVADVAVDGARLVTVGAAGVLVFDVADPARPRRLARLDTPGAPSGVRLAGDMAFVADGHGGLRAIDIADPAAPREYGSAIVFSGARGVDVMGDYVLVAGGFNGLQIVKVAAPAALVTVGTYASNTRGPVPAGEIQVRGDLAFVTRLGTDDGVYSVDIHVPDEPVVVGHYRPAGPELSVRGAYVLGRYALVTTTGTPPRLRIVDFTRPEAPREVGALPLPQADLWGVHGAGGYAFVASRRQGLIIFDVAVPSAPREKSRVTLPGLTREVRVAGRVAFVRTDGNPSGIVLVDVGDATRPVVRSTISVSDVNDFRVADGRLYVLGRSSRVSIFDVTRPDAPKQLAVQQVTPAAFRLGTVGDRLFLINESGIVEAFDAADATAVRRIGSLHVPGALWGVAAAGDTVYTSSLLFGLMVLRLD